MFRETLARVGLASAIVTIIVILALTVIVIRDGRSITIVNELGISPSLVFAAPSQNLPNTFDTSQAGLGAYINLAQDIELSKIESIMSPIYGKATDYVLGEISGSRFYAHQSGWVVAFAARGKTGAESIKWKSEGNIVQVNGLPGELALLQALETLDIAYTDVKSDVQYYHWGYPTASQAVLLARSSYKIPAAMTFAIPTERKVLEISLSRSDLNTSWRGVVRFNGDSITSARIRLNNESEGTNTITISPDSVSSLGAAVVLVLE